MSLQVVFDKISVYREHGVKDGAMQVTEHTLKRGETVPSWVSPHQAFVLVQTGMAKEVGDTPDPTVRATEPAPVVLPEHSSFSVLGTEITAPAQVVRDEDVKADEGDEGDEDSDSNELPSDGALKEKWETAAEKYGMDRGEAESMTKPNLVKEVKRRKAQRDASDTALPPSFS